MGNKATDLVSNDNKSEWNLKNSNIETEMEYDKSVYLNTDYRWIGKIWNLEGHAASLWLLLFSGSFYDDLQLKYAHNKYKICAFYIHSMEKENVYIANVRLGPKMKSS